MKIDFYIDYSELFTNKGTSGISDTIKYKVTYGNLYSNIQKIRPIGKIVLRYSQINNQLCCDNTYNISSSGDGLLTFFVNATPNDDIQIPITLSFIKKTENDKEYDSEIEQIVFGTKLAKKYQIKLIAKDEFGSQQTLTML